MARIDKLLKKHQEFSLETRAAAELLLRQRHPERAHPEPWVQDAPDPPPMSAEQTEDGVIFRHVRIVSQRTDPDGTVHFIYGE